MPLPLVLAGAAAAAGAFGVKKGVDAKSDYDSAKHWNNKAERLVKEAKSNLEEKRDETQESIESLGGTKFEIYENSILPFVDSFSKIKNIDFNDSNLLNASNLPEISSSELSQIKHDAIEIKSVVEGGVTALGSGGLAGLAAYGGVGWLGTASTGTAIGTLSGAAATNATLAWLGGGSLAAGGYGMAGGMMVLGGIVTGPVLAVGGMMLASKAEAALQDAYANYDKAELAVEEMKSAEVSTEGIKRRFEEIEEVITKLDHKFEPLLNSFVNLVNKNTDYFSYDEKDKKGIFMVASLAKTIKNIMEAPLIDKDGSLTNESRKAVETGNNALLAI